nr:reverse transcriptase domain-containing protein [Tanacetum cinerariifolium]
MPEFSPTIKSLLTNKDKLYELARTPLNKHYSAVLLKKLPEKLGDPGKFFIPCDFLGMDECLALVDLGASINPVPLSVWNKLSLPELTPTLMTLELADQSISQPIGVAKDVFVKVGKFHFSADFVVVDFDTDSRVPLILGVRHGQNPPPAYQAPTYQVLVYQAPVHQPQIPQPQVVTTNEFTNFMKANDSILQLVLRGQTKDLQFQVDAFLALEDDPTSPEVDHSYYDTEGDILLLKAFLNDDPSLPPPTQGMYLPQVQKELKICEAKNDKSSIDKPPEVELKDLPPHLKYVFLEGDDKLPIIIAKDLSVEEKAALIKVLKSHK